MKGGRNEVVKGKTSGFQGGKRSFQGEKRRFQGENDIFKGKTKNSGEFQTDVFLTISDSIRAADGFKSGLAAAEVKTAGRGGRRRGGRRVEPTYIWVPRPPIWVPRLPIGVARLPYRGGARGGKNLV